MGFQDLAALGPISFLATKEIRRCILEKRTGNGAQRQQHETDMVSFHDLKLLVSDGP